VIPPHLKHIVRILEYGLNTNSYKFALLRSLAEIAQETTQCRPIPYQSLAQKFLNYYWPLTILFRIRQATDPTRDPVVMKFIRREAEELKLSPNYSLEKYRQAFPMRYSDLVNRCCQNGGCFDEVIPRFHVVHRQVIQPTIYGYSKNELFLEPDTVSFLHDYGSVIESLAIGSWVRFTEQYTNAPRLYEKIRGAKPERRHVRYRGFLLKLQGAHCFYCQAEAGEMVAVDHVIPWCYVLEDRVWNLVLACKNCNSTKSNQTPADRYIDELINRNKTLLAEIIGGKIAAAGQVAVRDLREFITKDIDEHIRTLTANCRADGFGTWRHRHLAPDVAERGEQGI
jgi:5-methylcytosine-specific restriction endonuclease McrA